MIVEICRVCGSPFAITERLREIWASMLQKPECASCAPMMHESSDENG